MVGNFSQSFLLQHLTITEIFPVPVSYLELDTSTSEWSVINLVMSDKFSRLTRFL